MNTTTPTTFEEASAANCFGHGTPLSHGRCDCDSGYGEVDCRADYTPGAAYDRLRLNLAINLTVNAIVLLFALIRTAMVLRMKCRAWRTRVRGVAPQTPADMAHLRHQPLVGHLCGWMDTQTACLLSLVVCLTCNCITLSVGRLRHVIISQQVWYSGIVICELSATFFMRFFALIVAKYHKPTLRLITILDSITCVWCIAALLLAILMPFTDISDAGPVCTALVALIALWMIFLLLSTQIYTVTVLNTAIHGPALLRASQHAANKQSTAAQPHPAPATTPVAAAIGVPPATAMSTARTTAYTSNSVIAITTPLTTPAPPPAAAAATVSTPQPQPQLHPSPYLVLSAADKKRIATLTAVKRSVRGMQLVGLTALLSVALGATVFVATDATSLYANNNIG